MSQTVSDPSGNVDAKRTDVTDPDALRQELIRLTEDVDAGDLDTAENRILALLSDVRRAKPAENGGGE